MRIAVLSSPDSWYTRDLQRAAAARHEIVPLPFSRLTATVGDGGQRLLGACPTGPLAAPLSQRATSGDAPAALAAIDLQQFDAVLVRSMPPGSLEQVVFRMDVLARLEAAGTLVLNPPKALEAAIDKYLALARLESAGLPVPPTWVGQSADDALQAFARLGGDVVLKPLFGGEGRGIARLSDDAIALRTFKLLEQLGAVLYLQQFIPHQGHDLRLLVIGQRVLAMKRANAVDWRTNISRGATAEPFEPGDDLVRTARIAAETIGAPLAGVDLLPDRRGGHHVLEVNAVPGWKGLARALNVDVAALVLDYVESQFNVEHPTSNEKSREA